MKYLSRYRSFFEAIPAKSYAKSGYKHVFSQSFDPDIYKKFKKFPQQIMKEISGSSSDRIMVKYVSGNNSNKQNNMALLTSMRALLALKNQSNDLLTPEKENELKNFLQNVIKEKDNAQKLLVDPVDKLEIDVKQIEDGLTRGNQGDFEKTKFGKMSVDQLKKVLQSKKKQIEEKQKLVNFYRDNFNNIMEYYNLYIKGEDASQQLSDMYIVLSRREIDFASQSTEQGWTSCQNLENGAYRQKVGSSFSGGAFIAYLINKKDLGKSLATSDLHNAYARCNIKPLFNKEITEVFWYVDEVYFHRQVCDQQTAFSFRSQLTALLSKHNANVTDAEYSLDDLHYHEGGTDYTTNVDEYFRYAHNGDFSDIGKKSAEFIQNMMERYPKVVIQNWNMKKPFPNIMVTNLDLSNSPIAKLPAGLKAKNYNLSNTNIGPVLKL